MKYSSSILHFLVSSMVAIAPLARAQSPLSSILGTVTDQSHSPVPNAAVTVILTGKNYTRKTVTGPTGDYEFTQLLEGTYTVEVEANGFRKHVRADVPVASRQILRVDVALELGPLTQAVTVEARAPVVNSETATISTGWQSQQMRNFFLDATQAGNRTPIQMAMQMLPGSVHLGNANYKSGGARSDMFQSAQDGADVEHNWVNSSFHTVQEVKLVNVNAGAEYAVPVFADVVTRSGNNQLHAGYIMALRNGALEAAGPGAISRPPGMPYYVQSMWGGGPVYIPKLYNGRNRTFFYANLERSKDGLFTNFGQIDVPSARMRAGDLSRVVDNQGRPVTIRDPLNGQPFANNVIPADRINAVSAKIRDRFYPVPNVGGPDQTKANFADVRTATNFSSNGLVRLDQKAGEKNTLTLSFTRLTAPTTRDQGAFTQGLDPTVIGQAGKWTAPQDGWSYALSHTRILTARIVNEFRFNYMRYRRGNKQSLNGQQVLQELGIQGISPELNYSGFPAVNVVGFAQLLPTVSESSNIHNRFQYLDNVSIQKGRHSLKTGADIRRYQDNNIGTSTLLFGSYRFGGGYTGQPWADFLLGIPDQTQRFVPRPEIGARVTSMGFYGQDDFKLSPRITLNFGLRYELYTVPVDINGGFFNFDPKTASIVVPSEQSLKLVNPAFPSSIPIITAAQAGFPHDLMAGFHAGWNPRAGIAFRPFGNASTVVRAGYGMFTVPATGGGAGTELGRLNTGGPFAVTETFVNTTVPSFIFPRPFPSGPGAPPAQSVVAFNPDLIEASFQQWNVSVEREVWATAIRISYIGGKSTHLPYRRDINKPLPSTIPFTTARRNYPAFQSVTYVDNGANSTYHALQIEGNRPLAKGLNMRIGWTYAKELSDIQDNGRGNNAGVGIENPYNRAAEKGPVNGLPMPHELVANFLYELPFGKGRSFLAHSPQPVNAILGGWTVSGMLARHSGRWFTPAFSGSDPSNTNTVGGRPDRIGNGNLPSSSRTFSRWFDVSAFSPPPANAGRFGNSAVGVIQGPPAFYFNSAVYKYVPLRERLQFRFGFTAINILNHPVWDAPQLNISGSNVGQLFSQPVLIDFPNKRIIRFDLMLDF